MFNTYKTALVQCHKKIKNFALLNVNVWLINEVMSLPDDSTTMLPDGWLDKSERVHTSQMPWGFTWHEFYHNFQSFYHCHFNCKNYLYHFKGCIDGNFSYFLDILSPFQSQSFLIRKSWLMIFLSSLFENLADL